MTIVETRAITGGVDTHADTHVAAALDSIGGLLGVQEFPATAAGYARLLGWLGGFGTVCLVGIEGTGSYGAGLARHITTAGVQVVEVDRSDRQDRRRQGKSDPSTPSALPGPPCQAGPAARPRAATAPLRPSGPSWSPSAARRGTHPDHQPGQGPDPDRARGPAGPLHRAHRGSPGRRTGLAAPPPWQHRRLRHPHRAARARTARAVPRRPARTPR